MEPSGSGAAEPAEDDHHQEPAHGGSNSNSSASSNGDGAPSAAAPPPPAATPLDQAGGSSAPSLDYDSFGPWLTWSDHPVVSPAREDPDAAAAGPSGSGLAFDQRLAIEQAAADVANALWTRQVVTIAMLRRARGVSLDSPAMFNSWRAEEALQRKEQIRRKERAICSEHVKHQTHPITEVRRHHKLASDEANHLDAYSECRSVIGDGECFYRSFIFSYLEQVIDRQDTYEEHRLLQAVDMVNLHFAALRWNESEFRWNEPEFSRSSRAFKNLMEKVMRWKSHGRWKGMESTSSYRKEELLEFFSEYDTTQDIFIFLRLVVAVEICWHDEVCEPLIPGLSGNYNLKDWCFQRVTPARRFTDHVMMVALARALEIPLRVERVRGGYDPDIYTVPGVPRPRVTLLYSANHYEIIYPRVPPAESSSHQASQIEHAADEGSSQQTSQREHPGDESSSE
ncbi:uncharacterized protein LOC125515910 isoform X1 [Triticum urartu]|uniref:OTU domain-containing protein n=1 Tax=Triticum urartu TaxID=4572 RepID=A0A8R7QPC5_TRIUA|nr:uncharacterized protein LOC125515910 isoform X1 [Triticum urartu]